MGRGTGRNRRQQFMESFRDSDPALYQELLELRRTRPQAYRKKLRGLAQKAGGRSPIGGRRATPIEWQEDGPRLMDRYADHMAELMERRKQGRDAARAAVDEAVASEDQGPDQQK